MWTGWRCVRSCVERVCQIDVHLELPTCKSVLRGCCVDRDSQVH